MTTDVYEGRPLLNEVILKHDLNLLIQALDRVAFDMQMMDGIEEHINPDFYDSLFKRFEFDKAVIAELIRREPDYQAVWHDTER